MVGGWEHDFAGTGELVRTTALAMVTAYLAQGHDVVLPQLVLTDDQLDLFAGAAAAAGAEHVERRLLADPAVLAARFAARGDDDPWSGAVRALVVGAGGEAELRRQSDVLAALPPRPGAALVPADDDADATYARLLASLA